MTTLFVDAEPITQDSSEDAFNLTPNGATGASGELFCENGNHYWIHSGRGRKPRSCEEHRKTSGDKTPKVGAVKSTRLREPLTNMYVGIGTMVYPFDNVCGTAIIQSAERCAEALDALAKQDPAVRKVLERMVKTTGWGGVLAAHLPIMLMITRHHVPAFADSPMAAMMTGQGFPNNNG